MLMMPLAKENPVVVKMMDMPALDLAGTNRELVHVNQRSGMRSAMRAKNLAQRSAVV